MGRLVERTRDRVRREGAPQELAIPTRYKFRQAEIDWTWTELGWVGLPALGIIPLIGGLAFAPRRPVGGNRVSARWR